MWKRLLLVLAGVVLAPLGAELCARALFALRGEAYDAGAARGRIEAVLGALTADNLPRQRDPRAVQGRVPRAKRRPIPHPYFAWETGPGDAAVARDTRAFQEGRHDGAYTVMVVGGSVAGLFTQEEGGGADVLAERLAADPRLADREVRVLGHGRGAYKQPQQLFLATWLFALGVVPDAVINIDGFNEVAISRQNLGFDVHPLHPSFPQWAPFASGPIGNRTEELVELAVGRRLLEQRAQSALARNWTRSAILGRWEVSRLEAELATWRDRQAAYLARGEQAQGMIGPAPPFRGEPEEATELAVATWREASLDLAAACERRGVHYLHVLQPTLLDEGSKVVTDEERETGKAHRDWRLGVKQGYPLLRREGEVLGKAGLHFHDASLVFEGNDQTLYYDSCHFGRDGNVLLAEAVATAFLTSLP